MDIAVEFGLQLDPVITRLEHGKELRCEPQNFEL